MTELVISLVILGAGLLVWYFRDVARKVQGERVAEVVISEEARAATERARNEALEAAYRRAREEAKDADVSDALGAWARARARARWIVHQDGDQDRREAGEAPAVRTADVPGAPGRGVPAGDDD